MRSLIFWGTFPLMMPQALLLKGRVPRFRTPSGPDQGSAGSGKPLRLLGIGDSIIAGVGAEETNQALVAQTAAVLAEETGRQVQWQAMGSIGATTRKVRQRLATRLPEEAVDMMVVSAGVNDITSLKRLRPWLDDLHELLDALTNHSPKGVIAVAGIPPLSGFPLLPQPLRAWFGLRGRTFDQALRHALDPYPRCVHVPLDFQPEPEKFSPDGFHPSPESYREFGTRTAESLIQVA